jgi:hypothetical protein
MVFIVESPESLDYRCVAIGLTYLEPGEKNGNDEPLMEWSDGQEERQRLLVVTGPAELDDDGNWTWEGTGENAGTWRARPPVLADAAWVYPHTNFHFADDAEFYEALEEAMTPDVLETDDLDDDEG